MPLCNILFIFLWKVWGTRSGSLSSAQSRRGARSNATHAAVFPCTVSVSYSALRTTMFYLVPHTKYLVSHMTFAVFSHLRPPLAGVFSVKVLEPLKWLSIGRQWVAACPQLSNICGCVGSGSWFTRHNVVIETPGVTQRWPLTRNPMLRLQ